MFLLVAFIVLVIFAVGAVIIVRFSAKVSCPECEEVIVFPIVPGFKSWCPGCERIHDQADLKYAPVESDENEADGSPENTEFWVPEPDEGFDSEEWHPIPEKSDGPPTF